MVTTKSEMKAAILAMVRERGNRSFVDLGAIDGFNGDTSILADGHNTILWPAVSTIAGEVLVEMFRGEELRFDAISPIVYLLHGNAPRMPLADGVKRYSTPHWLPVLISLPRT